MFDVNLASGPSQKGGFWKAKKILIKRIINSNIRLQLFLIM